MPSCFVSVIIATHNRRRLLEQTLAALAAQALPRDRFEIVVVDNASTDGTGDAVAMVSKRPDSPRILLLHETRPGKSYAVNRGVAAAQGDLLVFTDDDVLPDPHWLTALSGAMDETNTDFAVGRIRPRWEEPPPPWLSPSLYGVLAVPDNGPNRLIIAEGLNEHVMPIGANMAVRRHVAEAIGGWRTDLGKLRSTLRSGEDHEFFLRMCKAGFRGVYEPTATVSHFVPSDRLRREYFRRWLYDNGVVVAGLEDAYPPTPPRLLGIPRYRWRETATDVWRLLQSGVRGELADRFTRVGRLCWFAGYLRGAWLGRILPTSEGTRT